MKKLKITILLLLLLSPFLQAQTLEEYLITAGESNPLLKARFAEYQAALEKVPQVGTLPDPEASFNFFLKPMERFMGYQVGDVAVMQMFPWFGSLEAAKDEAKYMALMKFASFSEAKIDLYYDVQTIWTNLYETEEDVKLLEKELAILKSLERIALAKYQTAPVGGASGTTRQRTAAPSAGSMNNKSAGAGTSGMSGMGSSMSSSSTSSGSGGNANMGGSMSSMASSGSSMVDVILLRVQVKDLENRLQLLRDSKRPLVVAFNNLLNREPDKQVLIADTLLPVALPASLSIIQDSILQNHPMLRMYEWDEKAREAQLRMAKLMGRPMIGLGLNYMVLKPRTDEMTRMPMGGDNMIMPMVTVTLPIYRKKYNALKKEAEYAQQAAVYQKEAAERQLFTELEKLLYDYQRATSTLELLKEQILLNEQAIRLLTTNYAVAGSGIEEILRQRQAVLAYRQQQLQAITEQHTAVHAISRLMNTQIFAGNHDNTK